ncbi:MAG: hypothetical protein WC813_03730 [Patescibacteria group bacterium]|jgi:hypothetical protein
MELSKQEFIEILDARFKQSKEETVELLDARFKQNKEETIEILDARFKQNKEEIKSELKHDFKELIVEAVHEEGKLIVDQMRSEIHASENRQDAKAEAMEKRIIENVSNLVDIGIIPQIEEHETRIVKLEQKTALA